MNEKINTTDAYLLHTASELYRVPYSVLTSIYSLGFKEGLLKGE